MRNYLLILLFSSLACLFSCEDQTFIIDCSDCEADEPYTAILEAKLSGDIFSGTVVQVWEGNMEDSILLGSYNTTSTDFSLEVILNKKYTVTATYQLSGDTYIAVDSAYPRVKYEKSQCEESCYYVYDRKCDLRLKYTK